MVRRWVLVVALLLASTWPASADSAGVRKAFWWGFGCSIGADVLDLYSTVYAHNKREDVVEGNRTVYGDDFSVGNLQRPLIIKGIGAALVNGIGYWMLEKGWGVWGNVLVWGNCIGKSIVSAHNFAIANDAPTPPKAQGLRLTFTLRKQW